MSVVCYSVFQCHASVLTRLTSAHWKAAQPISAADVCADVSYVEPAISLYEVGMQYADVVSDCLGECSLQVYIFYTRHG